MKNEIKLFESQNIRTVWDDEAEDWYFSIVDVIAVLTDSGNPRRYWSDLKKKLKDEGFNEVYEKIVHFKMLAPDGKQRMTDVANSKNLLRIIQSIPAPKRSLLKCGSQKLERID